MARLNIPITQLTRAGVAPATQVLGVAGDDLELAASADQNVWVEIENIDTVSRTATFVTYLNFDGFAVADHDVVVPAGGAASLTTALAGANNDMIFTADALGEAGNAITIQYVVAGLNTALSVAVTGNAIVVNVATDGAGAATSTAAQVKTAIDAHAGASALISVANAAANDGSGVVTAMAATALAGGAKGVMIVKLSSDYGIESFEQADGKVYIDIGNDNALKFRAFRL